MPAGEGEKDEVEFEMDDDLDDEAADRWAEQCKRAEKDEDYEPADGMRLIYTKYVAFRTRGVANDALGGCYRSPMTGTASSANSAQRTSPLQKKTVKKYGSLTNSSSMS